MEDAWCEACGAGGVFFEGCSLVLHFMCVFSCSWCGCQGGAWAGEDGRRLRGSCGWVEEGKSDAPREHKVVGVVPCV